MKIKYPILIFSKGFSVFYVESILTALTGEIDGLVLYYVFFKTTIPRLSSNRRSGPPNSKSDPNLSVTVIITAFSNKDSNIINLLEPGTTTSRMKYKISTDREEAKSEKISSFRI